MKPSAAKGYITTEAFGFVSVTELTQPNWWQLVDTKVICGEEFAGGP